MVRPHAMPLLRKLAACTLLMASGTATFAAAPQSAFITSADGDESPSDARPTPHEPRRPESRLKKPGQPTIAEPKPVKSNWGQPNFDASRRPVSPRLPDRSKPTSANPPASTGASNYSSVSERLTHKDGWLHGDSSGRIVARGLIKDGKRQGHWERYFRAGEGQMFEDPMYEGFEAPFTAEADFTDGQLDGTWTVFDAQRRKASEWEFRYNEPAGKSTWYYPDGAVRRESHFAHGQLHGEHVERDSSGKITDEATYSGGFRLSRHEETYDDNTPSESGWYADASVQTTCTFDWWQGIALVETKKSAQGRLRHGRWTWWYPTGQKRLEGEYHAGEPTGKFTWWFENGQQQVIGMYVKGQPHGKFAWWYPNGQKMLSVPYVAGEQSGQWMRWDRMGAVVMKSDEPIDPLAEFIANPTKFGVAPAPAEPTPAIGAPPQQARHGTPTPARARR